MYFEKHIRSYFRERLGVLFHCTEFGFIGYSVKLVANEKHLYINEFYVEPNTSYIKSLKMVRDVIELGKEFGCTHLVGCNQRNLDSYEDIKKLHIWFKMYLVDVQGETEFWAREI